MDEFELLDPIYDPSLDFPTDDLPAEDTSDIDNLTSHIAAQQDSSLVSSGGGGDVLSAVVKALGNNPSGSWIAHLLPSLLKLLEPFTTSIGESVTHHPLKHVESLVENWLVSPDKLLVKAGKLWEWFDGVAIDELYMSYLTHGLGLNEGELRRDAGDAIKTVDSMLGFAVALQFIAAAIESIGHPLLANRWTEAFVHIIKGIPEEMGLSWALGQSIDEAFKAAQGVVLEEAINRQKTPQRLGWPQIRLLLKQHVINSDEYHDLLLSAGFDHHSRELLDKLQDVLLPIGDIAQLWYRGQIDDGDARLRIAKLGFSDTDAELLFHLYVDKSENEASVLYRSTARQLFIGHLIAEDQYRQILGEANYPQRLIDQDVKAINFEHEVGKVLQGLSIIKTRYQQHLIGPEEAKKELELLNYAPSYIAEVIEAWDVKTPLKQHGLSQAKILSYLQSGAIDKNAALPMLLSTGLTTDAAQFLIDHPTAARGTKPHQLTPGLAIQAYVDGALDDAGLRNTLMKLNVTQDAIEEYLVVAQYRKRTKRQQIIGDIPLTRADIDNMYKYGLVDFDGVIVLFENLGYSPEHALILAEIANHGKVSKPPSPLFTDVIEAAEYLESLGYVVYAPPDPRIEAAEILLAQYGYTWQPPLTPPKPTPVQLPTI